MNIYECWHVYKGGYVAEGEYVVTIFNLDTKERRVAHIRYEDDMFFEGNRLIWGTERVIAYMGFPPPFKGGIL